YEDLARRGLVGALRERGGEVLAHSLLEPLDALPAAERQRLRESAKAWLDANGAWDPAARALGIHRHTLRARLTQLEGLLRLDLSTFAARAELWAALEFSDGV
ncbi:helix-turn-helix domain-containing protein, partial [uncultured Microbacterium sp.]